MSKRPGMSLPSSLSMTLRTDQDKHPGAIVAPRPKRSSEEVAAIKARREQEKNEKAKKLALAVKNAARLEDQMEKADEEAAQQVNRPPINLKKRELRVRKERPAPEGQYRKTPVACSSYSRETVTSI